MQTGTFRQSLYVRTLLAYLKPLDHFGARLGRHYLHLLVRGVEITVQDGGNRSYNRDCTLRCTDNTHIAMPAYYVLNQTGLNVTSSAER